MDSTKKAFEGVTWGVIVNVVSAIYGFISVPLLIDYFGKGNYGIIVLANSVNIYLSLMDMGMGTTNTRFFSGWLVKHDFEKLRKLFQSSLVFYIVIGAINAIILLVIACYAEQLFNLKPSEVVVLKNLLYILAVTAIFNWISAVFRQLIYATENVGWAQKMTLIPKLLLIIILVMTLCFSLSMETYFLLNTISLLILLPIFIYKTKALVPQISFVPKYNHQVFKAVIPVSLTLFTFTIFSFTANNIGPVILGVRTTMESVTDYRIVMTIASVILILSSVFSQSLLPAATKMVVNDEREKINQLAEKSTKYIVIVLWVPILILFISGKEIIRLYLGESYDYLVPWLAVGLANVFMTHTSGIASLVYNSDNLNKLALMAAISMIISIAVSWYFSPSLGAGGAILALFLYSFIQTAYGYLRFYPKYLRLSSKKIFIQSVFKPVLILLLPAMLVYLLMPLCHIQSNLVVFILNSLLYSAMAIPIIWYVILKDDDKTLLKGLIKRNNT